MRLRVFVTRSFRRFQRKECIGRPRHGRSGGYRTVIAYMVGDKAFFLFGFAKSDQDNIGAGDERELADYGEWLLGLDEPTLRSALEDEALTEIAHENEA